MINFINFLFFSLICFIISFFSMIGYYLALFLIYRSKKLKKEKDKNDLSYDQKHKLCKSNGYKVKPLIIKK